MTSRRMRLFPYGLCAALLGSMALLSQPSISFAQADEEAEARQQKVINALNLVPEDAAMVVMVPDMSELSRQLSHVNTSLGLGMPELADALSQFKRRMLIGGGFRDDGAMLMVINELNLPKPGQAGRAGERSVATLLAPVDDYNTFISGYQGSGRERVTKVQMPMGYAGFARQVDRHAVMSQRRELVSDYRPGNAANRWQDLVGQIAQDDLLNTHITVLVNLDVMQDDLLSLIDRMHAEAQQQMQQQADGAGAQMGKAVAEMYVAAAKAYVQDAAGLMIGGNVSQDGISFTFGTRLERGSALAQIFDSAQPSAELLNQMPSRSYLMASALNFNGVDLDRIVNKIEQMLPQANGQQDPSTELIRMVLPLASQINGAAGAYYTPGGRGMMGPMFNGISVLRVDNPQQYIREQRAYMQGLGQMQIPMGPANGGNQAQQALRFNTTYREDVMNLGGGVRVDQYQITYQMPQQLMREMGQFGPMMMMMGGQGSTGYVAAVDGHVIVTQGDDATLVSQAVEAVRQKQGLGQLVALGDVRREGLPDDSMLEVYYSIGGMVRAANGVLQMISPETQLPVPNNLPPIAQGLALQNGSLAGRTYVPMDTLKFVKDLTGKLQEMMPQRGPAQPQPAPDGQRRRGGRPPM